MAARSYSQIVKYLDEKTEIALQNVAARLTEKLEEFVKEDFYNMYSPKYYSRTYSLLKSRKYEMLGKNTAKVFIDTDAMHYLGISGEDVATLASYGFHGSVDIFRPGYYWTDFVAYCDDNVIPMLKEELRKQNIPVI